MNGSLTATTSMSSLVVAMRITSLPIRPNPTGIITFEYPVLSKMATTFSFHSKYQP